MIFFIYTYLQCERIFCHVCFAALHSVVVEVSPDIHICGFCKQQFNNFEVFRAHKQNGCAVLSCDTTSPANLTGTEYRTVCLVCLQVCVCKTIFSISFADSNTEFVFEETYKTCVMRGVKKTMTKAQKTPKKLKPSLTSRRHSCCFSGLCLLFL